jgi:tetratricopeptide (TPR) repeat protein
LAAAREAGDEKGVAHHLHSFANLLTKMGDLPRAERVEREALAIRESAYPEDSIEAFYIYVCKSSLGKILTDEGRLAEAEPLLLDAEKNYDPPHMDACLRTVKLEIIERLAELYEAWDAAEPGAGHAEQAVEWRAMLDMSAEVVSSP